jgi:hypothetical protein
MMKRGQSFFSLFQHQNPIAPQFGCAKSAEVIPHQSLTLIELELHAHQQLRGFGCAPIFCSPAAIWQLLPGDRRYFVLRQLTGFRPGKAHQFLIPFQALYSGHHPPHAIAALPAEAVDSGEQLAPDLLIGQPRTLMPGGGVF